MVISNKTKFATQILFNLATDNKHTALHQLAEKVHISLSYAEQITSMLRKGGLVVGTRGPGGGYTLTKDPGELRIGEIVRCINEEPVQEEGEQSVRQQPKNEWGCLSSMMLEYLDSITLADVIHQQTATCRQRL